jgi:hypothetical protein
MPISRTFVNGRMIRAGYRARLKKALLKLVHYIVKDVSKSTAMMVVSEYVGYQMNCTMNNVYCRGYKQVMVALLCETVHAGVS